MIPPKEPDIKESLTCPPRILAEKKPEIAVLECGVCEVSEYRDDHATLWIICRLLDGTILNDVTCVKLGTGNDALARHRVWEISQKLTVERAEIAVL